MTSRQRLRRMAFLCSHALANFASYRAGFEGKALLRDEAFWRRLNGNFLDIGVLEWCKLFVENRGAYSWKNALADPATFQAALFGHLELSEARWVAYCKGIRHYRDKYVAHLDEVLNGKYPQLDMALKSTKFLYAYLLEHEDQVDYFVGLPVNPEAAYRVTMSDAKKRYRNAT